MTKYTRLAIDMGTTSIGWALLATDAEGEPEGIITTGVRIFSSGRDDKSEAPLNQKRQSARSARRRQDRTVQRRKALIKYLVKYGFMPADEAERKKLASLNPYELRRNALYDPLPPHHIGRAFFHINQGRGFKSNRKQQGDNKEGGAIQTAIENTQQLLLKDNSQTIGEYLHKRQQQGEPVKIRNISNTGSAFEFEFYRQRKMLEEEFDKIWQKQKTYSPDVYTQDAYDTIRHIIFHQRPLKSKKEHIGKCTLFADEIRASKALPIYQNFRIVQDMVNLAYIDPQGYDHKIIKKAPTVFRTVYENLASGKNQSFKQIKTALLKAGVIADDRWQLNFESDTRKGFDGNETAYILSAKKDAPLSDKWDTWDIQKQTDLVKVLLDTDTLDDDQALQKLQDDFNLDIDTANRVLNAPMPDGYGNLCEKALNDLQPVMLDQGLRYDMAIPEVYPDKHHSDLNKTDGSRDKLPYYAQELPEHCTGGHGDPSDSQTQKLPPHLQDIKTWGRIANPTVHIGLVQLQAVVNDIIRIHGKPDFATVEFARDLKNNKKQKDAYKKRQKENKDNNDKWAKELAELGLENDRENRLRMRLWYELDWDNINNRKCPYTGTQISKHMLFSDSVEIEHILPYARTLDDNPANKTVAMRTANRFKGNRSPYEAFGTSPDGYDWDDVYTRAQHLPKNKARRFSPTAMDKYADGSFIQERQLNDTRYLSKVAKKYLGLVIHKDKIHVIPGQLTAMLRGKWGLDEVLHKKSEGNVFEKNRNDHRHHAIDAVVIGCTTRGMLQKIAHLSGQNFDDEKKLLSGFDTPWDSFRDDVKDSIDKIVISHKPDPYPEGQLHEETFYGRTKKVLVDKKGNPTHKQQFVIRKPVTLDNFNNEKKIREIRDPIIRQDLLDRFHFADRQDDWLQKFITDTGIHKIRVLQEKLNLIKIGTKYVIGGNNWAIDIYIDPKNPDKWMGEVVQTYHANQPNFVPQWKQKHPEFKRIMRLQRNNLVSMYFEDRKHIMRVVKMNVRGAIFLAHHNEANVASRAIKKYHPEKNPFPYSAVSTKQNGYLETSMNTIKQFSPKKIHISPSGLWHEQSIK